MGVGDVLKSVGTGLERGAKATGAVLGEVGRAYVEANDPGPFEEQRKRQEKLEDEQIDIKAKMLENQLLMGQKYGTLTPQQQEQYVTAISALYSHPRHAPMLMEKLRKAVHPQGAYAQDTNVPLANAMPEGGTALRDVELAQLRAKPSFKNFRNTQTGETITWDENQGLPGPEWVLSGTASGIPRSLGFGLGIADAITAMNTTGQKFMKPDGTAYTEAELRALPPNMKLSAFTMGGQLSYGVADQTETTMTVGNQVFFKTQFGEWQPQNPLGVARVPIATTTTATAPGGRQVVTGTRMVTPQTSGAPAPAPAATPGTMLPRTVQPSPARTITPGRIGSLPKINRVGTAPKSILPDIQNMTPANARMAQKTQPAVSALLGLYGDPANPSAPSMMDYAKLADDPHAQQLLGEAFKLLDQQMGEISDPGILQTLGTAAGWANFRAQVEAGAQQAAGTQMTPQERAYFDAAISSMADIIGSRSATGQSAARFSVRSIQNELPLIGLSGTPDSTSYLTKMQTISRQVRVGLNAMPDNSRALAWLNKREADIVKQKASVAAALGGKPVVVSPEELKNAIH